MRIVVLCLIVLASHARARAEDKPWAVGVSDVQMKTAETLLAEGNALFVDKRYLDALDRYTRAIASWDHPAIRFNMVRCLIQLGRNFEAFDNINLALRHGPAPLEKGIYEEALNYKKLLERQVAEISVKCSQSGVKVTLDGQPLLDCPGERTKRVEPGDHQVVGIKPGFLTSTTPLVIVGGAKRSVDVELALHASTTDRWKPWKPWALAIAGVTVAGAGAVFQLASNSERDKFVREVEQTCADVGCNETGANGQPRTPREHERRAKLYNRLAIGAWITGALAAATGGALVYLNRPVVERTRVTFVPSTTGGAVSFEARF